MWAAVSSTALATAQNPALHIDGCEAGGGAGDLSSLHASYDIDLDRVSVDLEVCAPLDPSYKYRLRIDHEYPQLIDADRNGDGEVDQADDCVDTSDSGLMLHHGRSTGPGVVSATATAVRYHIDVAALDPTLAPGTVVYLWADSQHRGIGDRLPTPEAGDGCLEPQLAGEAVALRLAPPPPVLIHEVVYDGDGSDADDVFTEISGPPSTSLDGWTLVGINGSDGTAYRSIDLTGATIPIDGRLVIATASATGAVLSAVDFVANVDWQNGPDAVQLFDAEGELADALQYGDAGVHNAGEGAPAPDAGAGSSLSRDAVGTDTDDNASDFFVSSPTPGGD